ncbi:MAG: hypothetical protein PHE79_11810 [Eubacteriales bacterium]|nr:hypothetical protein [Eubacteriales bacterium]
MFKTAKKIEYAFDLSNASNPVILAFPIVTNTAIELGEVVKLAAGFVVAVGDTDQDDPYLGIAAQPHDGASDGQTGTMIQVYCSPTAVFKCTPAIISTADSGNGTTWVDAELTAAADDTFNGGILKLSEKATASTLTDPIGTLFRVTDFATTSGTFTGVFAGNVSAGDKAVILPPVGSLGWDLNAGGTNLDLKAVGGESIRIVKVDPVTEEVFFMLRLHQLGNSTLTI